MMDAETKKLFDKFLDNQRDLIAAIVGVTTAEQLEALRAIAEAQYNITESLLPATMTITGVAQDGPMTMQ